MKLFSVSSYISDQPKRKKARKPFILRRVNPAGAVYGITGATATRSSFERSEYNLGEVSKVIDIEAYVRQAFGKHVELCLKEGYEISSRNEEATQYIKRRLKEMAEVSSVTFEMLLRSITQNIIAYSNAFLAKVRNPAASSGRSIARAVGEMLPPIAAYFTLDPTSIQIKRNYYGKVLKYKQKVIGNPRSPEFKPEDVIHFYYDRKEGLSFGTPYIIPVLDDIRTLRRLEENIEMLMNQHLFPLYQYTVGTEDNPAEIYDDGTTEVDYVKDQVENMPTEGSIVTPERHDIKALGAEGKALDAADYLEYFEKRVLAGLGMSEIALGRGGTANRATAATIDKMMQDRCKDFQDVIETFINEYMMKELLYEGGFVIDEAEDNFVKLKFKEIDIDNMLKTENHTVFKYEHDAITETEMRESLGKDPVSEAQRDDMYFERVSKPKAIILAVDEPYTAEAKAGGAVQKISKEEKKKKETANREKPTNQHGTKPAKTRTKKDELLEESLNDLKHLTGGEEEKQPEPEPIKVEEPPKADNTDLTSLLHNDLLHFWNLTRADITDYIRDNENSEFSRDNFNMIFSLTKQSILDKMHVNVITSLHRGIGDTKKKDLNIDFELTYECLKNKVEEYTDELLSELGEQLVKHLRGKSKQDAFALANGVFDTLKYKLETIAEREINKAYRFGCNLTEGT